MFNYLTLLSECGGWYNAGGYFRGAHIICQSGKRDTHKYIYTNTLILDMEHLDMEN